MRTTLGAHRGVDSVLSGSTLLNGHKVYHTRAVRPVPGHGYLQGDRTGVSVLGGQREDEKRGENNECPNEALHEGGPQCGREHLNPTLLTARHRKVNSP